MIVIAVGVFLPSPLVPCALILALVVAAFIWVFGEAFGQILADGGTDPNSALLLALLVRQQFLWILHFGTVPGVMAGRHRFTSAFWFFSIFGFRR